MSDNYFELGIANGGVPVRCYCHCPTMPLVDAQAWDGDPDSPTFGVTPLQVPATHDVAVTANVEEHPWRPEHSRVSVTFWGPKECTHGGVRLTPEQARQLARQLIEAADETEELRN
jgi:hypothetical protein